MNLLLFQQPEFRLSLLLFPLMPLLKNHVVKTKSANNNIRCFKEYSLTVRLIIDSLEKKIKNQDASNQRKSDAYINHNATQLSTVRSGDSV